MFPSGAWKGYWKQDYYGTQEMEQFQLHFRPDGTVTGEGTDIVGAFVFRGTHDPQSGAIAMTKQYLGKHTVEYVGGPDGEGKIVGTWDIWNGIHTGPFCLYPVIRGDEPIQELVR